MLQKLHSMEKQQEEGNMNFDSFAFADEKNTAKSKETKKTKTKGPISAVQREVEAEQEAQPNDTEGAPSNAGQEQLHEEETVDMLGTDKKKEKKKKRTNGDKMKQTGGTSALLAKKAHGKRIRPEDPNQ